MFVSLNNERIHLTTREVLATDTDPSDGNHFASIANTSVMITIKGKATEQYNKGEMKRPVSLVNAMLLLQLLVYCEQN